MSDNAIEVDNLSKLYRLGAIGTGSLRQDINYWWTTSILKKENPFFKLANNETTSSSNQLLWALKDVSFQLKHGERLGIIGPNGSGKSTLLKIISRIVRPSKGTVRGKGKVSSLLEVGTGFNTELSGRENIFVSGYILGMSKAEIKKKFDEIVAFSGIEKFIDTPVKRYSSGMYVRLAFAVAAHLEPDILIVDEVLAVGDADFQKKCLGKMREVSQSQGRTILFVSHSMQAINSLCDKALWLQSGQLQQVGEASVVVNKYISRIQKFRLAQSWHTPEKAPGNDLVRIKSVEMIPELKSPEAPMDITTPITVKYEFWNYSDNIQLSSGLVLYTYAGECIFDLLSPAVICSKGLVKGECKIPGNFLNDGSYYISINFVKDTSIPLFNFEECLSFELEDYREGMQYYGKWWGAVRPSFPFKLEQTVPSEKANEKVSTI
jgi:lipopolysaccharide transport system ATP-binding protein